ncbi:MAG: DOMON-like domain-containing protein [Gammaproteobacteria bacterium]|nr:DOMON-like domain-containing protein [Gammaproteobacteria bacterium]MDH5801402.1 DOMON-like domain-containing protein [Gammaproteobacteria bacterium]
MKDLDSIQYELLPYDTHPDLPFRIVAQARQKQGILSLNYRILGDTSAILWPKAAPFGRGNNLWQHTCLECFLADAENTAYWEYNFSPAGVWDVYFFSDYRRPQAVANLQAPQLEFREREKLLRVRMTLPPALANTQLRLGLSAVMEDRQGQLFYYALKHTQDRPDFHQRDSFILML